MTREIKFAYNVFDKTSGSGKISLGTVAAINPDDAILEYVTKRSTDPLDRSYANKSDAGRHLGYFRETYRVEVARKDGSPHGKPLKVKNK